MKKLIIISLFVLGLIIPGLNANALSLHGVNIELNQAVKKTGYIIIGENMYNPSLKDYFSKIFETENDCQNHLEKGDYSESYNYINYTCTTIEYNGREEGLYEDDYESGRYIYEGVNPNNYIKFNNELWRIISFESDGTIKILRNEVLPEKMVFDIEGTRTTGYCGSEEYFLRQGCNAWAATTNMVGSPNEFVNGEYKGTVSLDSNINIYLNREYYNSISVDKDKIVNHDFNIGPVDPFDDANDLVDQLNDEKSYKWNGKVGLITASDFLKSNSNQDQCGTMNLYNWKICSYTTWMYIPGIYWWTISPEYGDTGEILVDNRGYIGDYYLFEENNVRPALYLNSNIYLKGNGTEDSPYEITDKPSDAQIENNESTENQNPQIVNVPSTSAYGSIIIIVLGIICVIVSVLVMRRVTSKNNS